MREQPRTMPLRHLSLPGQILAWAMILFPLSGLVLAQMVPGTEGAFRRVRLMGLMADSMALPVLGVFLGAFLAEAFAQRGLRRLYLVVSAALGLFLLVFTPVLLLDVLEVRGGVQAEMKRLFDLNSLRSSLVVLLAAISLLLLAVVLWRSLRSESRAAEPDRTAASLVRPTAGPAR